MNAAHQLLLGMLGGLLVVTAQAEPAVPVKLRLALDLNDGSRVVGNCMMEAVAVESTLAKLDVPLKVVTSIRFGDDHRSAVLDLRNGDKVEGRVDLVRIELETLFGPAAIGTEHIRALRVLSISGALPPGDGPLAFGGLNWTPWRTQFEVRDDRLVSLPVVRPGFNYGHGGNGRGAAVMCNVGSCDWVDYCIEFELGMTGVDPAFNPHALPAEVRSASIGFHYADAKESWNERGMSGYSFNFNGDGTWTLGCSYNGYCKGQCGYVDPTHEGPRVLAEGKGLKTDPQAGNKVRIEVCGTRIRIWVDGVSLVDQCDPKMTEPVGGQTLDHGGVYITWGFESMGWIRNFSAKPL